MKSLFVYGTLAPGEENAHIMDGVVGTWEKASVRGKRFAIGWGTHSGHPGLIPDENGDLVHGLIFTSDDLPAHWDRLDRFEGVDYQRVRIAAKLETGETIQTYVYQVQKTG